MAYAARFRSVLVPFRSRSVMVRSGRWRRVRLSRLAAPRRPGYCRSSSVDDVSLGRLAGPIAANMQAK